jgi:GNAT superfamily N-acetyltransferase
MQVRPLQHDDYSEWQALWQEYLKFYRSRASEAAQENTFARLMAASDGPWGLGIVVDGRLRGIAHYLFHCTTWTPALSCYLQDLFVASDTRGLGLARALIDAVYQQADAAEAGRVYWTTQEYNAEARALYDTVAHLTSFVQYRR